jgi:hypothetical protein
MSKRLRGGQSAIYPADVWETDVATPVPNLRQSTRTVPRPPIREMAVRSVVAKAQANATKVACSIISKDKKIPERKMGGLSLPDVVRELLKERNILRWNADEGVYEVIHGENFETRFNELRKVRNKSKPSGVERPFSRMYNFFVLESGDKWARTGTKFRPRNSKGYPTPGAGARPTKEVRRVSSSSQDDQRTEREASVTPAVASAAAFSPEESDDESDSEEAGTIAESITEQTHGETCGGSEVSEPNSPAAEEFFLSETEVAESEEVCESNFQGFSGETPGSAVVAAETNYYSPTTDFTHPILDCTGNTGNTEIVVETPVEYASDMDVDSILRPEGEGGRRGSELSAAAMDSSKFLCLKMRGNANDDDALSVCDVSSPDASCQSSPEGALSLCGEFGGSPLDIGAPALDHAAAACAMMMGDACDGILIAGLDAPMCW